MHVYCVRQLNFQLAASTGKPCKAGRFTDVDSKFKQLLRTTQFFTQTAQHSDSRHDKTESGFSFSFFWNLKISVSSLFDHTLNADGTSTHTFSLTFLNMNEAKTRVF